MYLKEIPCLNKVTLPYLTRGNSWRQGVTGGYKRLQGITGGYRGLQGVTKGYRGLQGLLGVTRGYGVVWYGNFIYTQYFLQVHLDSSVEKLIT